MKYLLCDIDGSVSNPKNRLHHIKGDKKDYDAFHSECVNDAPIDFMVNFVQVHLLKHDVQVVFVSGRADKYMQESKDWLHKHIIEPVFGEIEYNIHIRLRKEGDRRPNVELKEEWLKYYGAEHIKIGVDDDLAVIEMYHRYNVPALLVPGGVGNKHEEK